MLTYLSNQVPAMEGRRLQVSPALALDGIWGVNQQPRRSVSKTKPTQPPQVKARM